MSTPKDALVKRNWSGEPVGVIGVVEQTGIYMPILVRLDRPVVTPLGRNGTSTWTLVQATGWESLEEPGGSIERTDRTGHTTAAETAEIYAGPTMPRLAEDMVEAIRTANLAHPDARLDQIISAAIATAAAHLREHVAAPCPDCADQHARPLVRGEEYPGQIDELKAIRDRTRAELKRVHRYIGVQVLGGMGIEAPKEGL